MEPALLWKGKRGSGDRTAADKLADTPKGTMWLQSETPWIDGPMFAAWLKAFALASGASPDCPTVLICDNHDSRFNLTAIDLALEHNILLLLLPPNTTRSLPRTSTLTVSSHCAR